MTRSDEASAVVPALVQAIGCILRRMRVEANPVGLSTSQSAVLATLVQRNGMTNADLARAQAMKPQSMNALLKGLEQENWVKRHRHPTDGRQVVFTLTKEGSKVRNRASASKHAWLMAAMQNLSSEQRKILHSAAILIHELAVED